MPARTFAACAIVGVVTVSLAAQTDRQSPATPDARLTGRAEQVRVEVRVTDDNGNPVTNLQSTDFEIRDDGKSQDILTFTFLNSHAGTAAPVRTDAANTVKDEPTVTATSARAIVLVLDDLHVAATNTPRVTKAVREFLDVAVSAADLIALVFTSGASRGGQDFTSDRRLVLGALDRFRGQKLRSATVERLQDPRLNLGGVVDPNADPNQADRANRARISLDALHRIGEALAKFQDQRPMVLFVSEGPEYEVSGRSTWNRSDQQSINNGIRDAVQSLNRVNATVFAIDPRGVATGNADQIHASSVFEALGVGTSALNAENLRALGVVQAVSANTGGFTMLWRPDMSRDFRRLVAADGSYYVIGYGAPSTDRGKYHNISVSVRKRGLQVRARTGYFLPSSTTAHTEQTRPAN